MIAPRLRLAAGLSLGLLACDRAPTSKAVPVIEAPASATAGTALPSVKAPPGAPRNDNAGIEQDNTVVVPELAIPKNKPSTVRVMWKVPEGTGVNDEAPFRVRWTTSEGLLEAPKDTRGQGSDAREGFSVAVTPAPGIPSAQLKGTVDVVVCDVATHKVCVPVKRRIDMAFRTTDDAKSELKVELPLPNARAL